LKDGTIIQDISYQPYLGNGYIDSIYYCSDAVGLKTGTTSNAGCCLIAAFQRNEKTYLSAVVGCSSGADRYELTLKMLSEFASYSQ